MKRSAAKPGIVINSNQRDEGTGKWLTLSSPDYLFKINMDIDFHKLSYMPLMYDVSSDEEN